MIKIMNKEQLLEIFKNELPHLTVRKFGSNLQVRKGVLTFQNIEITFYEKRQSAKVRSMYDNVALFFVLMFPIGIYILLNKNKYVALKQEVVQVLQRYGIAIE